MPWLLLGTVLAETPGRSANDLPQQAHPVFVVHPFVTVTMLPRVHVVAIDMFANSFH